MKRGLPFLLLLCAFAPPERYVPADGWRLPQDAEFYEDWYGAQLRAMGEPILSRPGGHGRFRSRFRLLVLPSFDHGYAIRVDESASGGRVHFIRLTGRGGYAPGEVAEHRDYRLGPAEMHALRGELDRAGLASAPQSAPPPAPEVQPDGSTIIHACFDGTAYVFELVDAAGSHFVQRHDCARSLSPTLRRLVDEVVALRPDRARR